MKTEETNTSIPSQKYQSLARIFLIIGILLSPLTVLFIISQIPDPNEPGGWAIFLGWIFYGPFALLSTILIIVGVSRIIHIKHSPKVIKIKDIQIKNDRNL